MEFITYLYLLYSFLAFYFFFFFFLLYNSNKGKIFTCPEKTKDYSLSLVIPCFNAEKIIGDTIKSALETDYPGLKKIIVVDDCSTDNTYKIIKQYAEKYEKVIAVQTPKPTGCAAGAKNYGAKFVDTELIAFTDDDSCLTKNVFDNLMGFFDNSKIASATPQILVKNRVNLLTNLQSIEYKVIAFTRKLLGFVDAIYVTPGPLAVYRKKIFDKVGRFDEQNMTEDIEITWNIVAHGYKVAMSFPSRVYTIAPTKFKAWFRQRKRWNVGGMQTIWKYRKNLGKMGTLGSFIMPFFIFSWLIGLFGLIIIGYRFIRGMIIRYLSTTYSIETQTAILRFSDINLTPNLLVFFGAIGIVFSLYLIWAALLNVKEKEFKKHKLSNIIVYMFIYVLIYPVILVVSTYKFLKGDRKW